MASNSPNSVNYSPLSDSTEPISSVSLRQPSKKQRKAKWFLGLLLFSLAAGSYLGYRQFIQPQQQAKQRTTTVPVQRTTLSITISANGTIEPEQVVNVSPKTSGIMTRLLVKEGDYVSKGQVIAYMDDSNLQGQLTQAKGQLSTAEANLQELLAGNRKEDIAQSQARVNSAQADLNQAEDDLQRNQALFESGAISRQTYNQAHTARETAAAKLTEEQEALALTQAGARQEEIDQARGELESAKGELQTIQAQIDDTIIKAPFSGIVTQKYAEPGAFVTPMTSGSSVSSATSSSILSLASTNQVVANVAESSIAQIRLGQAVTIEADAYPGKKFQGQVSQIATEATVEQNVTSFEVEVSLHPDAEKLLRSGMNASVEFQVGQLQNAITVPTVAVTRQQNVTGVLVPNLENPDRAPHFIPITTGATVNDRTEVKAGLKGDEKVLINLPPGPKPETGISLPGLPGSSPTAGPPDGGPPGGGPPSGGSASGGAPSGPPPQ